jgi:SAM-dependent methyltransferase
MNRGSIAVRGYHSPVETPSFPKRDPGDAEFWDLRYAADFAPWDAGRVPAQLQAFAASSPKPRTVLVPGCGSGWDVRFLADSGWKVLGLDFSHEALAAARRILGPHVNRVRYGDFFARIPEAPFEVVYERAFLCALPRRRWSDWGRRMAEVVQPAGLLAGFFYFDTGERGPPFALHAPYELCELLEPAFTREVDEPVPDSIEVFKGKERWMVWARRG